MLIRWLRALKLNYIMIKQMIAKSTASISKGLEKKLKAPNAETALIL